jgi:DNA polymerase-3 subunit chi
MSIYFVETTVAEQRDFLCRWTERFYMERRRVQILVDSTADAQLIDKYLWTFSQSSFIPHVILSSGEASPEEPVLIISEAVQVTGFDTVICDCTAEAEFMSRFDTAVHFILRDDAERKQQSRALWQRTRDLGLSPVHVPYVQGRA